MSTCGEDGLSCSQVESTPACCEMREGEMSNTEKEEMGNGK